MKNKNIYFYVFKVAKGLAIGFPVYIMDNMLGDVKSHKNPIKDTATLPVQYESSGLRIGSYLKLNKLIIALYMITDIMDKNEPLRLKLRELGSGIISDTFYFKGQTNFSNKLNDKVSEILSFLEIASSIGIISEMNASILMKEFLELRKSIFEFASKNDQQWIEEFLKEDDKKEEVKVSHSRTNIGVQKGSTLLKALSDRIPDLAHTNNNKNKRRDAILSVIKDKSLNNIDFPGMTITDIKSIGHNELSSCGEKTLQRELIAMVSDGILKKTGQKRWSRYSLK